MITETLIAHVIKKVTKGIHRKSQTHGKLYEPFLILTKRKLH